MRRSRLFLTIAAGTALALVGATAATAAPALAPGQWIVATGPQPATTDFTATPLGPFWSAVVLQPGYQSGNGSDANQDYDLWALDASGKYLNSSRMGIGEIDYVAIDSNTLTNAQYTMQVQKYEGIGTSEQYRLVFAAGNLAVVPGRTALTPPAGAQPNNTYIRDLYLRAGQHVTIFAGGDNVTCPTNLGTLYLHAFLLGTEPGNPSATPVQGRSSALSESFSVQQRGTACGVTVSYTAKRNAWYGLLMVDPAFRSPFVDMAVTG